MQINGQHIILRSIKISDAKYFLKWTENSDNVRYSLWDFQIPKTLEDYKEYIKISNDIKSGKISFIICDKKSQLPIGEIGLNHIDLINKRARTFTLIGDSKYRAQGLGKEAKQLIIDYAFNTLNLNRLYCSIIEKNEFWISSLINLGFKIEGREREASFREGKYYDKFLLGITRKDWQK
ncbi:MAG: GNAT family N-acetyltransferase, partial [Ignavibacteria bacterium]|nr:GNAT family N-acetyltransferase [Ignavibacteria bacterium]